MIRCTPSIITLIFEVVCVSPHLQNDLCRVLVVYSINQRDDAEREVFASRIEQPIVVYI
ncbi:uncharacterized protein PHALS_05858 [Plasmopara halstedii]|uniref:Uncharacterized protein n=1 Tax=Plasmopara halstedii TaxID=4781 RepID=A0A0N7L464_PLAHL|nr:uncharacterized protein PHALS_05858 [Plasmopara halstedii]CEG37803.1 hypothetical protein PHALS_05858 [Plasmopara halstedii]|eukprot:XP_024574172.1 hypothetical protein PHALS_05858 [Plasmopara halstedii]